MSKAQFDIYRRKVFDLAKTLVVKSHATADAINRGLSELGNGVNEGDPTTWKYYLNLGGQYHPTDVLMTVTSLDTLQTIDFTRDNLQEHQATARGYAHGSRYYNELVKRFPLQENLILGILNPVDIPTAIAAEDGDILYYNSELVEENETNLIPRLQAWTKGFMVRWNVRAYTLVDDLYAATQLAIMYQNIPGVILNIRLDNCHTHYAHTFHIREFLASNGRLDSFVDYLSKKQMLWLYRNIRYIHRNAGMRQTFELLMQKILTERGLPLAEWSMRHNLAEQPTELYPRVEFARKPLNFAVVRAGVNTRTVEELLTAEQPVAKGNVRVQPEAEIIINTRMENSINDKLSTKVLESAVLDLTDASPFTLSDALLNHWLYFTALDRYKAVITVDNPKTGGTFTFNMREAFIVFLYTYNKARGLTLSHMPILQAIMVRRDPTPTRATVRKLTESRLVSNAVVDKLYENLAPVQNEYISTAGFSDGVMAIHRSLLGHRDLWATRQHWEERGQVEQMASHLYCDWTCDLAEEEEFTTWFAERGFDIPTFSTLEAELLANQILEFATGKNLKKVESLKEIQGAMLRLMSQLSSYSIQYLQSINSAPVRVIDWPVIRTGDPLVKGKEELQVAMIDTRVQDILARGRDSIYVTLADEVEDSEIFTRFRDGGAVDLSVRSWATSKDSIFIRVLQTEITILKVIEPLSVVGPDTVDDFTESYVGVDRVQLADAFTTLTSPHYALTNAERIELAARWAAWVASQSSITIDVNELPGIDYPPMFNNLDTDLPGHDYPYIWPGLTVTQLTGFDYPQIIDIENNELDGIDPPDVI